MVGVPRSISAAGSIAVLAVTMLLIIVSCGDERWEGRGETLTVDDDGGEDFVTIREALENASYEDTIRIFEGEYEGDVVVRTRVNIIGNGSDITIVNGGEFDIEEDNVQLSNIGFLNGDYGLGITGSYAIVENVSATGYSEDGIILRSTSGYCSVQNSTSTNGGTGIRILGPRHQVWNCTMDWNSFGVYIENGDSNRVAGCTVTNGTSAGIFVGSGSTDTQLTANVAGWNRKGILVMGNDNVIEKNDCQNNSLAGIQIGGDSSGNMVKWNVCKWNSNGIEFDIASDSSAEGNMLAENEIGIYIFEGSGHGVTGNDFHGNEIGISIRGSMSNEIRENMVVANDIGMYLFNGSRKNTISGNHIEGNLVSGIHLRASHETTVTGNLITQNHQGLFIEATSKDSAISGNDIFGNGLYGLNALYNNGWGVFADLNYWGDYTGPYRIFDHEVGIGDQITDGVIFEPWSHFPHTFEVPRCEITGEVRELHEEPIGYVDIQFDYRGVVHTVSTDPYGRFSSGDLPCENRSVDITIAMNGFETYQRTLQYHGNMTFNIDMLLMDPPIQVSVIEPTEGETVKGNVEYYGLVTVKSYSKITVQLKIDGENWYNVSNETDFQFMVATGDLQDGTHTFSLRATDGWYISDETQLILTVRNHDRKDTSNLGITLLFIGIVIAGCIGVTLFAMRTMKAMESLYGRTEHRESDMKQWEIEASSDKGIRGRLREKFSEIKESSMGGNGEGGMEVEDQIETEFGAQIEMELEDQIGTEFGPQIEMEFGAQVEYDPGSDLDDLEQDYEGFSAEEMKMSERMERSEKMKRDEAMGSSGSIIDRSKKPINEEVDNDSFRPPEVRT